MGWTVFQLLTTLAVLLLGIVLGRIWEARTKMRSKHRIMRWDLNPNGFRPALKCDRHQRRREGTGGCRIPSPDFLPTGLVHTQGDPPIKLGVPSGLFLRFGNQRK